MQYEYIDIAYIIKSFFSEVRFYKLLKISKHEIWLSEIFIVELVHNIQI